LPTGKVEGEPSSPVETVEEINMPDAETSKNIS